MRLTVTLYVQCLCCYVMSPTVFWTFFRTRELGLSLQVPVLWNKHLISNPAQLTSQRGSIFRNFSVLLLLFTNLHGENSTSLISLFIFHVFYSCEEKYTSIQNLCTLTIFHIKLQVCLWKGWQYPYKSKYT